MKNTVMGTFKHVGCYVRETLNVILKEFMRNYEYELLELNICKAQLDELIDVIGEAELERLVEQEDYMGDLSDPTNMNKFYNKYMIRRMYEYG